MNNEISSKKKYLRRALKTRYPSQNAIPPTPKSDITCQHLIQNHIPLCDLKILKYTGVNQRIISCECEIWALILKEAQRSNILKCIFHQHLSKFNEFTFKCGSNAAYGLRTVSCGIQLAVWRVTQDSQTLEVLVSNVIHQLTTFTHKIYCLQSQDNGLYLKINRCWRSEGVRE